MLHLLGSIWSSLTDTPETRVLILGNSNSGKTAVFERFKMMLADDTDYYNNTDSSSAAAAPAADDSSLSGGLAALKAEIEARKKKEAEDAAAAAAASTATATSASASQQRKTTSATTLRPTPARLAKLKNGKPPSLPRFMTPTVGLNVGRGECTVTSSSTSSSSSSLKVNALLWDVGGDPCIRQLWLSYLIQCHGVVFCFDLTATGKEKTAQVKLLHQLMMRPELAFAPFLIVGTKFDQFADDYFNNKCLENDGEEVQKQFDEKAFLNQTELNLRQALRFEDLAVQSMPLPKKKTNAKKEEAADANEEEDEFESVDDNLLIAMEASDIVNAVPQGRVSGIAGHMYHVVVASAVSPLDGQDLRAAMQWILSVSATSRARATALEAMSKPLKSYG